MNRLFQKVCLVFRSMVDYIRLKNALGISLALNILIISTIFMIRIPVAEDCGTVNDSEPSGSDVVMGLKSRGF